VDSRDGWGAEAGFSDGQPDPAGGALGRDERGRLDGVVFERPMFELFERNFRTDITRMGAAGRARLVESASRHLAALGVTTAADADTRRDTLTALAEADDGGALGVRVYGMVVHDQLDWLAGSGLRGRHSSRLAAEAVKIWADGGMSSRTAAIHGTYPVPPHGSGILFFDRDELTAMVRDFDARGFQVCIHAQGDPTPSGPGARPALPSPGRLMPRSSPATRWPCTPARPRSSCTGRMRSARWSRGRRRISWSWTKAR
jgi:hypothetical protein